MNTDVLILFAKVVLLDAFCVSLACFACFLFEGFGIDFWFSIVVAMPVVFVYTYKMTGWLLQWHFHKEQGL